MNPANEKKETVSPATDSKGGRRTDHTPLLET